MVQVHRPRTDTERKAEPGAYRQKPISGEGLFGPHAGAGPRVDPGFGFRFLANVNSRSRSLYVVVRPSVVCLSVCLSSSSSSLSIYLFIKQFHKNMTADSTRTGPTRLAKHSQWPQHRKKTAVVTSVTFMRPTQATEIFGNVSMPFGISAIHDLSVKILGEPLRWGELNTRGVAKYSDFGPIDGYISETVQDRSYVQSINQSRFFSVAQNETITETTKAWTVKLQ